jgi:hypothetical protein
MLNANEPIYPSSDNPISPVTTKKKTMTTITWSPLYIDPTQTNFNLAVTYSADVSGTFTVDYKMFGGRGAGSISFSVPKGSNMTVSKAFTTPTLGQPMKLSLSVPLGTLTVSSLVLTEAIGYMSTDQVLALQSAGHEIGNHTEHHCDLGVLQNNPTGDLNCALPYTGTITVSSEVGNAQTTLLSSGFTNVNTFAYPYGGGAGDQVVEGIVKNIGLTAASSTTSGYNTPTTNRYNLSVQSVVATTTIADIQGWIDYAAANKLWLILLFHQVENNPTLLAKETYGTTTAILQSAVNYALTKQSTGAIQVMPVRDVITTYYH